MKEYRIGFVANLALFTGHNPLSVTEVDGMRGRDGRDDAANNAGASEYTDATSRNMTNSDGLAPYAVSS